MPLFTHWQQAVPGTAGHYFAALAGELMADMHRLSLAWRSLDECPLGAAAVGGTSAPIDERALADLLGFGRPLSVHSTGDVPSGTFGPCNARLLAAMIRSMEAARIEERLDDYLVTTEATH